jgi:hypothetical protein
VTGGFAGGWAGGVVTGGFAGGWAGGVVCASAGPAVRATTAPATIIVFNSLMYSVLFYEAPSFRLPAFANSTAQSSILNHPTHAVNIRPSAAH